MVKIGDVFGRLTVITEPYKSPKGLLVDTVCSCGNLKTTYKKTLKNGSVASCGCLRKETTKARATSHGMRGSKEYIVWAHMRSRCNNPNDKKYPIYGGRGISICAAWESFENFIADVGLKPSPEMTLDRIDTNKNYTPDNVRWATNTEQANNRRSSVVYDFRGQTLTIKEIAKITGTNVHTLKSRLRTTDLTLEEAVSTPISSFYGRVGDTLDRLTGRLLYE